MNAQDGVTGEAHTQDPIWLHLSSPSLDHNGEWICKKNTIPGQLEDVSKSVNWNLCPPHTGECRILCNLIRWVPNTFGRGGWVSSLGHIRSRNEERLLAADIPQSKRDSLWAADQAWDLVCTITEPTLWHHLLLTCSGHLSWRWKKFESIKQCVFKEKIILFSQNQFWVEKC